jgi:CBS-domain-containing membrane protein
MTLNIKVGECMTVGVFTLSEDKTVFEASKLLRKTSVGSIIVTHKGKAKGIVTERDIIYKVISEGKNPKKVKLKEIMSYPLKTIKASDTIEEAANALRKNKIKRLPVLDSKNQLIGIITETDLLRVYPGVVDVLSETYELRKLKPNEYVAGVCEVCGCFSEELKRDSKKLRCPECIEEEEV